MKVIVRDNKNVETVYNYEPAQGRELELQEYYSNLYRTLQIQGFMIEDNTGKVLSFRGSI